MDFFKKLLDFGEEVSNTAPMSDRIVMGLQTMLLGMGVIFTVLIILWAVLAVFKVVFYKPSASEKKSASKEKTAEAPAPVITEVHADAAAYSGYEPDDAELVAVITAAIASMLDAPQTSFRVVSFRRTARK